MADLLVRARHMSVMSFDVNLRKWETAIDLRIWKKDINLRCRCLWCRNRTWIRGSTSIWVLHIYNQMMIIRDESQFSYCQFTIFTLMGSGRFGLVKLVELFCCQLLEKIDWIQILDCSFDFLCGLEIPSWPTPQDSCLTMQLSKESL